MLKTQNNAIKQAMIDNWIKCENSFSYFLFNFWHTQDNKRKTIRKFERWAYLERLAHELQYETGNIIINKPRQMAISNLLAAYCAWRILFFRNWQIPMISKAGESAFDHTTQSFGGKIVFGVERLPGHLRQTLSITFAPKRILNEAYNSGVMMYNSGDDSATGGSGAEGILDEAARLPHADMIMTAIAPSVQRLILNSTFNGDSEDQVYYSIWADIAGQGAGWKHVALGYYDNPEHNEQTYQDECAKLGYDKRKIASELDCNPSMSISGKMFAYEDEIHIEKLSDDEIKFDLENNCLYTGHDIGYSDGHAYVLGYLKVINNIYNLYCYKDYYETEKTYKDISKQFKEDSAVYPHKYQQNIADPTADHAPQGQMRTESMFSKFALEGVTLIGGSNDHNLAIITINTILTEVRVHIHPDCKHLLKALAQAHYPTDRSGRVTDYSKWVHDKNSHILCAFSYLVLALAQRIGRPYRVITAPKHNIYGDKIKKKIIDEEIVGIN